MKKRRITIRKKIIISFLFGIIILFLLLSLQVYTSIRLSNEIDELKNIKENIVNLVFYLPMEKEKKDEIKSIYDKVKLSISSLSDAEENSTRFVITLSIILFIYFIGGLIFLPNSISLPLKHLLNYIKQAKNGGYSVEIEDSSKDEIGEINRELSNLLEKFKTFDELKREKIHIDEEKLRILIEFIKFPVGIIKKDLSIENCNLKFKDSFKNICTENVINFGDENSKRISEIFESPSDHGSVYIENESEKFNVEYKKFYNRSANVVSLFLLFKKEI